jgi:hypothetical protein
MLSTPVLVWVKLPVIEIVPAEFVPATSISPALVTRYGLANPACPRT